MSSLKVWLLKALCCMIFLSSCCLPAAKSGEKKKSSRDLGDQPTDKMPDSSDQEDPDDDDKDLPGLPAAIALDNPKTVSWENQPDGQYYPGYLKDFDCEYTSLVLDYVWSRHPVAQNLMALNKETRLDHELLADNTVKTLLRGLDPYRVYFTQDEVDSLVDQYDGRFFLDVLELGSCHHLIRLKGELEKKILSRQTEITHVILSDHDYTQKEFFSPYGVFNQDHSYYLWPSKSELSDRQRQFVKWLMLSHQVVGRHFNLLEDLQSGDVDKLRIKDRILQTHLWQPFLQTNESFQFAFGKALLWSLDHQSVLLDRFDIRSYYSDTDLRSPKLGLSLLDHPSGYLDVYRILGGSDAEGRLQQGDLITHLREGGERGEQWISTKKVSLGRIYDILAGPEGMKVDLKVQRPVGEDSSRFQSFELSLERRPIGRLDLPELHSVPSYIFEVDHDHIDRPVKVGYIVQNGFNQGFEGFDQPPSDDKVAEIVRNFMATGVDTIILDYRQNAGGDWDVAADMMNIFSPKATAYYQTSYEYSDELGESQKVVKAMSSDKEHGDVEAAQQVPLVVLVSSETISAAEMVVGALKVYGRALIIGENTYGGGLITETKRLFKPFFRHVLDKPTDEEVGGIRYVTGHFLKPDGTSSHITGEVPDIRIVSPFGAMRKQKWLDETYRGEDGEDNDFTPSPMEKESSLQLGFRDSGMLQKLTAIYSQHIMSRDYQDLHSQWMAEISPSAATAIQKHLLSRKAIYLDKDHVRAKTLATKLAERQQFAMHRFIETTDSDAATYLRNEDHELQEALFVAAHYFWLCRGDHQDPNDLEQAESSYNKLRGCLGSQAAGELGNEKAAPSESRQQAASDTDNNLDQTPETEQSENESESP